MLRRREMIMMLTKKEPVARSTLTYNKQWLWPLSTASRNQLAVKGTSLSTVLAVPRETATSTPARTPSGCWIAFPLSAAGIQPVGCRARWSPGEDVYFISTRLRRRAMSLGCRYMSDCRFSPNWWTDLYKWDVFGFIWIARITWIIKCQ